MSIIGSSVGTAVGSSLGPAIGILLLAFFTYAFAGILSFIPWVVGFMWSAFYFPVELINQTIYPVGQIVYLIYTGLVAFVVVSFLINLFKNHN